MLRRWQMRTLFDIIDDEGPCCCPYAAATMQYMAFAKCHAYERDFLRRQYMMTLLPLLCLAIASRADAISGGDGDVSFRPIFAVFITAAPADRRQFTCSGILGATDDLHHYYLRRRCELPLK